jgi:hypothetical protein
MTTNIRRAGSEQDDQSMYSDGNIIRVGGGDDQSDVYSETTIKYG